MLLLNEEKKTTQWPKEKVQKDKQWSSKYTHKTKDQVTRTPLKIGGELRYSGRASSSCSTSGTRRVNIVMKKVSLNLVVRYGISMSQITTDIFHCRKHFPVLSSSMAYYQVCNYINTTGATSGAGTDYPPGFQWGSCYSIFNFSKVYNKTWYLIQWELSWQL
jgi:hypothetical protein